MVSFIETLIDRHFFVVVLLARISGHKWKYGQGCSFNFL